MSTSRSMKSLVSHKPAFIYVFRKWGRYETSLWLCFGWRENRHAWRKSRCCPHHIWVLSCWSQLRKIVDMLYVKDISSPKGNLKWIRAAVDKLLSNAKYIPIVNMETYMDVQFERNRRCNVDYSKAGHPRKAVRYHSPLKWNKAMQIPLFLLYL